MGFLSKLWKGLKRVVGTVAMIAAPFVSAPIAGALGISGTIGTALVGAGIGGLGAAAAGMNPLVGAALGGLGGFGAARAASGGAKGGAKGGDLFGGLLGGGKAAEKEAPAAAAPAAGLNLGNIAPLAMAMFGKSPQNLTPEELAAVERNKEIAATERGVFNQKLEGARALMQAGEANPERAFAEAQMGAQRGLREAERTSTLAGRPGLQDAERRRASIEGARLGTAAVTGEQTRAAQTKAAGLSMLPTNVPTSGEELNMAIYSDLYKRRADYARDLSGAFGQMYGDLA